jgi:Tol biopolymer transport system component
MTGMGVIMGTVAYMSPEPAKGKPVDKRTDIWAFGCVLYEMLTGRRAFEGEDVSDTLATVLKSDPDWARLPADTSPSIRRLLRRCLTKDRKARLPDIAIARFEIDDVLSGAFSAPAETPVAAIARPSLLPRWMPIAAAGLSVGLVVGAGAWALLRPRPQPVMRLTAMPADGSAVGDSFPTPDVAISPDGRHIVYTVGQSPETVQLFVRSLDQLEATPLRGLGAAVGPFVSPDGEWVGYVDGQSLSVMKKVSINGGPPVTICTAPARVRGASWGPDDTIGFGTFPSAQFGIATAGLFRVAAGGGKPEALTKPDSSKGEAAHILPEVLAGGRAVLFTIVAANNPGENNQIAVLDLGTGRTKALIRGGSSPRYVSSGHLVYAAAGSLRAVGFDVSRLEVRGNPVPVVEHVATKGGSGAAASFDIARDGTLIYRTDDAQGGVANRTLVWVDRQGHEEPIGVPVRAYVRSRLSPDGTRIALDIRDQENDIWVWDFAHTTLMRLTFDPGLNRGVAWSPDSRRIAFSALRDGSENVYWQAADGTGTAERLTDRPKGQVPWSFTPDGTRLLFQEPINPPSDVGVVDLTGDRRAELLLHGPQNE